MAAASQANNGAPSVVPAKTSPMSNPRSWPLFKNVDEGLLARMKLFHVFGKHGESALFVTNEDQVYGLGSNKFGVLGLDVAENSAATEVVVPKQVMKLNGQGIVKFASGDRHVLAVTGSGKILSWGDNTRGQMGQVNTGHSLVCKPQEIAGLLAGKVVIDVACGSKHSAAITNTGELYAWGFLCTNVSSIASSVHRPILVTYQHLSQQPVITAVACGASSTHYLTANKNVGAFGQNDCRQMGSPKAAMSTSVHAPIISVLPHQDPGIVQIACGPAHCLAVNKKGTVYSWGKSGAGQLGRKDAVHYESGDPACVPGIGKVAEVAAIYNRDLSVARTCDDQIYVWGLGMHTPTLTTFKSIQEAFSHYTLPSIAFRSLMVDRAQTTNNISDTFRRAFNDRNTCDVEFKVDGKVIYVHRAVLKIRSQYFQTMFQGHWKESSQSVIEIKEHSYFVYHAFLKYIYTNEIESSDCSVADLIGLLKLANLVIDTELKSRCELLLKRAMTADNTTTIYDVAVNHASDDLRQFSLHFAARNLPAVMKSVAFKCMTADELRGFMTECYRKGGDELTGSLIE